MRAFGQSAVADFAAAGAADAAGFADGEIREVIMEDEFLFGLAAGVGIKFLRVFAGAERDQRDRLRFAAGENRRTVRARQDARLRWRSGERRRNARPSRRLPLFEDQAADGFFLDVIERVVDDELA